MESSQNNFTQLNEEDNPPKSQDPGAFKGMKEPKDENIFDMLKWIMCPNFTFKSFTFWISIVQIILFIFTVGACPLTPTKFLAPQPECLVKWGANYAYSLHTFKHFHRLIIGTMMHSSFIHLVMNLASQLMNGALIENLFAPWKFVVMYFGSALSGILFALVAKDKVIVGASTAIFGLLGATLALQFTRSLALEKTPMIKTRLIFQVFTSFFMVGQQFMEKLKGKDSSIDLEGHIGGALGGFLLTLCLVAPTQKETVSPFARTLKYTGVILFSLLIVSEVYLFFFVKTPVDRILYYE